MEGRTKKSKRWLIGFIVVVLLASTAGAAFAAKEGVIDIPFMGRGLHKANVPLDEFVEDDLITQEQADKMSQKLDELRENPPSILSDLVEEKIITQEQSERICEYLESRKEKGFFGIFVDDKIISQEQADKLEESMHEMRGFMGQKGLPFDILVEEGVISEEKAQKAEEYLGNKYEELKEIVSDMTLKEKREYIRENRPDKGAGILEELVQQKILTEEDVDNIKKRIPEKRPMGRRRSNMGERFHLEEH